MSKTTFILALVLLGILLAKPEKARADVKKQDEKTPATSVQSQDTKKSEDKSNKLDLITAMNECNDSFRIEMSYIEALNESGSFPDESDRTPKCYVRCVLEHTGVASEDGQFNPARAAVVLAGQRGGRSMDDVEEMAAGCSDRQESCKCERSYKFMKCLMEAEIKKYGEIKK